MNNTAHTSAMGRGRMFIFVPVSGGLGLCLSTTSAEQAVAKILQSCLPDQKQRPLRGDWSSSRIGSRICRSLPVDYSWALPGSRRLHDEQRRLSTPSLKFQQKVPAS